MTVQLFGNGPSPAFATYGLRRTVQNDEEMEPGVKEFVERNFYVDVVLKPTAEETVKLVRDTHAHLSMANLRLHKVVSSSLSVKKAFPTEVVAKDIRSLDLTSYRHSVQSVSFGTWKKLSVPDRPFTRGEVLSLVNSIYDPLDLASLVLLESRLLLQELVAMLKESTAAAPLGWDDPLPDKLTDR